MSDLRRKLASLARENPDFGKRLAAELRLAGQPFTIGKVQKMLLPQIRSGDWQDVFKRVGMWLALASDEASGRYDGSDRFLGIDVVVGKPQMVGDIAKLPVKINDHEMNHRDTFKSASGILTISPGPGGSDSLNPRFVISNGRFQWPDQGWSSTNGSPLQVLCALLYKKREWVSQNKWYDATDERIESHDDW